MTSNASRFRTGDWVYVRSANEIAATLDRNGALDGMPFMPEMIAYCGRRFQVQRRAQKACIEFAGGAYKIQEFIQDDLILLDAMRCNGASHDGCQRGCLIFWRSAWLRHDEGSTPTSPNEGDEKLRTALKTKVSDAQYFCQSTEMAKLTQPQTRFGIIKRCIDDVRSGSRGAGEMIALVIGPIWRKVSRRFITRSASGTLTKTPVVKLSLQPGEEVEIKSVKEISETLDANSKNRGLLLDYNATCKYGGARYKVRTRVDRMINEATGEMCSLNNTVILENVSCTCHSVIGGCPRQDPVFWREAWLKRVNQPVPASANHETKSAASEAPLAS